jgi:deazaflavin-dependent oxidoreductase (nitroreductase family)
MARQYRLGPVRRAVNAVVTPLVKLGVTPRNTVLLTTTGRKSGQPRTTPVSLVDLEDERWLVSSYGDVGWVHNVRALPRVVLRRGKKGGVLPRRAGRCRSSWSRAQGLRPPGSCDRAIL